MHSGAELQLRMLIDSDTIVQVIAVATAITSTRTTLILRLILRMI